MTTAVRRGTTSANGDIVTPERDTVAPERGTVATERDTVAPERGTAVAEHDRKANVDTTPSDGSLDRGAVDSVVRPIDRPIRSAIIDLHH